MNAAQQGLINSIVGKRGEKWAYAALTEFEGFKKPLFNPAFLGETWAIADYYVELEGVRGMRPIFLVQVKTKHTGYDQRTRTMRTRVTKSDVKKLCKIPLPTYVLAACNQTKKVFIKAVVKGDKRGFTSVPSHLKLNAVNLVKLHQEVADFWKAAGRSKPSTSQFV